MKSNTVDLPVYEYAYQLNGSYTKELRGIWEMENDFMGGPFSIIRCSMQNATNL